MEEIDDLSAPPPLPSIRTCSAPGCRRQARDGGRHCKRHHAEAVERWRKPRRRALNAQRRDEARDRTEDERAADVARAKLAVYITRGKIAKGACVECGSPRVTAYIADPAQWQRVVWVCRDHRAGLVEGIADRARQARERDAQAVRRERLLAAFDALPADEQARIREVAARGPIPLTPEAPLYMMRLLAETEKSTDDLLTSDIVTPTL